MDIKVSVHNVVMPDGVKSIVYRAKVKTDKNSEYQCSIPSASECISKVMARANEPKALPVFAPARSG